MLDDPNLNLPPYNQPHLLLWDTPNELEINQLVSYNNAERVNYRQNLLQRINPTDQFLTLHRYLERELDAIKSIGNKSDKPLVLPEGLDCFITYLQIQPHNLATLFWANLEKTRKLESLLWILIPTKLKPPNWSTNRLKHILSG